MSPKSEKTTADIATASQSPEHIIVVDERGVEWSYRVDDDPEIYKIVKSKGTIDERGRLVLTLPLVAALKGWNFEVAIKKIEQEMKEINVPDIFVDIIEKGKITIPNFDKCTNLQLEEHLSLFGGYRAYLEAQLAYLESKRQVLDSSFEEGMSKSMFLLSQGREKKPLKEALHGEAIASNSLLRKTKQDLIELNGLHARVLGMRDAYKSLWDTVSRIMSLRISGGEKV